MKKITLTALFDDIADVPAAQVEITGLTLDSRTVKSGYLFFACQGTQLAGRTFIDDAIQKGASAVMVEEALSGMTERNGVPIISVPDLSFKISDMAARFYDYPARKMRIVGITGTNGKTSCSHFIGNALHQLNISCGIIGTLGNGLYGHVQPSSLTTPDIITLHTLFADFLKQGAKTVAMEVSSHSLDQGRRVNGIEFATGVFTNLTRDHLDYHGTMEAYGAAKKRLFDHAKQAVINADDPFGLEIMETRKDAFSYSIKRTDKIFAEKIYQDALGAHATISTPWGSGDLHVPLIGQFNLSNVLAVLTTLCLLDVPFFDALNSLSYLQPVPGRMQTLGGQDRPLIVVDYAHTPDALEKVLMALREHCHGKLFCVFGCGGDRDRGKRPMMAKIAEQYADQIIVTDDNPRHENPHDIVTDIMRGFEGRSKIIIEHDRSKAILDTIQCAVPGDCVLIAGKGAETYQQKGDEKFPFSDVEKVQEALLDARLA